MKKNIIKVIVATLLLSCSLTSCNVLLGILSDLSSVANLANCEYDLKNVTDVTVAGVSVKNVTNGDISALDIAKLSAAILSKKVPLQMNVNVGVTNPTTTNAALTALDWKCEIDGKEFINGSSTQKYTITPSSTTTVVLPVSADVYEIFSQGGLDALKNFVGSFQNDGTSSKVAIKIKPTVDVAGTPVQSSRFIPLEKKTGNSNTTNTTNTTNTNNNNNNSGNGGSPAGGSKPVKTTIK